jgi:hypothetical protein
VTIVQLKRFAPIDDTFDECPKYASRTVSEMGMIACAITYANRNLSDGRIPKVWPGRRFGREGVALAKRLVQLGVWTVRTDDDYEIVGFLDHNLSRDEVVVKREKKVAAGRRGGQASAAARARANGQANGGADAQALAQAIYDMKLNDTKHQPVLGPESVETETKVPAGVRVTNASSDGAFGDAVSKWCEGISQATGQPFTRMANGAVKVLVEALNAHRPDGAERVAWAGAIATEYATANKGHVLSPFNFAEWMGSGKPARQAPRGVQQNGPANASDAYHEPAAVKARERAQDADWSQRKASAVRPPTSSLASLIDGVLPKSETKLRTQPPPKPDIRSELTDDEREANRAKALRDLESLNGKPATGTGQ